MRMGLIFTALFTFAVNGWQLYAYFANGYLLCTLALHWLCCTVALYVGEVKNRYGHKDA